VSDLRLSELDRETIISYAQTIQKLPKNRKKRHGETPIAEVLKLNTPEKDRASERTLAEKLIRVKAFLGWCRVTKRLPKTDPTERISFKAHSQSYAPFTQDDLQALFGSKHYLQNGQAQCRLTARGTREEPTFFRGGLALVFDRAGFAQAHEIRK
jgi:hypothetical protein